ncbi:Cupin domain protein [compost metagenome]
MKHFIRFAAGVMAVTAIACERKTGSDDSATAGADNIIFKKGVQITNANFTGTVWLQNLITADSLNPNAVGSVTFEPGARSNWHLHPAGQILLAIEGVGYYQEEGQPKIILRKGDAVRCPPGIRHWHGASADTAFVQVAITGREKGETVWLETVSPGEYHR